LTETKGNICIKTKFNSWVHQYGRRFFFATYTNMAAVTSCESENDLFRIQNKPIAQLLYNEKRFFESESNKAVAFQLINAFFIFQLSIVITLHLESK